MRKLIVAAFLLVTPLASSADVAVEELLVRRQDSNVNIRVNLHNPSSDVQQGPIVLALMVRKDANKPWTTIHTWNNISKLAPGYRVSRDYFDENNSILADLAASGAFEVRAFVRAPGDFSVESTTTFDG